MNQTVAGALRPMLKLLPLALLLPVITGFDDAAPESSTVRAPEAIAAPASPSTPPTLPDVKGTEYKWQRVKDPKPLTTTFPEPATPPGVHSWETGAGKSYLIPALEVPGFLILLSLYDRIALGNNTEDEKKVYSSTFSTTWEHLSHQNWAFDKDPFNVNQFGHPYQGSIMYGLARSSGLNFWESLLYSNAGSFMWEMAGETGRPSINDLITTGNSGSLLGEALFRMSALVLKAGGPKPDPWHEAGAAVLSPPSAFNRLAFDERFKTVFPSHDPATFWRLRLGASLGSSSQQNAVADFAMSYGLPGKPGYTYRRPLDYFDFQIGGLSRADNPISYVLLRGLLLGRDYRAGEEYRGIWGLYGSYDYLSPTPFRVSTTALSLGTTGQYWVGPGVALQGSLLGGVGFGAGGVTSGDRDYHYGVTPQALLALNLLFGTRASLELIGRGYYVSGAGSNDSNDSEGSEKIARITTGFNVRVYRRHGIGLQFIESIRRSQTGSHQSDGTLSLVYTFLGDSHLGAVEWRDLGSR